MTGRSSSGAELGRRFDPRTDEILGLDPQSIGDAGDVIEVSDHLSGVVDGPVVEAMPAQFFEIFGGHLILMMREFGGEVTQRPVGLRQRCAAPVAGHRAYKLVRFVRVIDDLLDLFTEVVCVGLNSIVAIELGGGDRGQHFALHAAERRVPEHDC